MMDRKQRAIDRVMHYWNAAARCDHLAAAEAMADDIVRQGPQVDAGDEVRGKAAYVEYIHHIQSRMSAYRNATHDIRATDDGSRVYIQCTEWPSFDGHEYEFPLLIILDLNDAALITKIDIYWKTRGGNALDWVRVDHNQ